MAGVAGRGAVLVAGDAGMTAVRRRFIVAAEAVENAVVRCLMAFGAGHGVPSGGDGEGMVEDRAGPARRRGPVTVRAVGREARVAVVGIGRAVIVGQVAGHARGRSPLVDAV